MPDPCASIPSRKIICKHHCELVSRDMLYLGFVTKLFITKNQNSKIKNVGCKNITFQLPYAKEIETPTTLDFL
jgi:hypothetical protein